MTEEEKEAIKRLKDDIEHELVCKDVTVVCTEDIQTVLNLLEKKDKIIDKMAEMINTHDIDEDLCGQFGKDKDCSDYTNDKLCVECIKQYFERQVEENE